jgi:hypothetical protein
MGEMVGMGRLAPRLILMLRMIGHRRIFGSIHIPRRIDPKILRWPIILSIKINLGASLPIPTISRMSLLRRGGRGGVGM